MRLITAIKIVGMENFEQFLIAGYGKLKWVDDESRLTTRKWV